MVLDNLGSSLKSTLQKVARALFVDEKLINELIKDIQRALLTADVNVNLVFELTNKIKQRLLKEETPSGLTKKEYLINVVYEELANFLGKEGHKIVIDKKPFKILLVGLFGSGKTTTIGKLAHFFSKRGYKIATLGLDVHRPAAPEQLNQISTKLNIPCFISKQKDPLKIYKEFEQELQKFDIIMIDTAGRDALSDDLIEELNQVNNLIKPDVRLLVISADIGQAAQKQAEAFHEACGITGIIITKLDGTAKGGGALTAAAATKAPVNFIGVGEKTEDLEEFEPKRFVGRLLGMGDIESLLEKAREAITEEEAQDLGKKLLKGEFNLIDLYEQMQALNKMGPLSKVMELVPGFSQIKLPKEALHVHQDKLKKWRYILDSMTKQELEDPDKIDRSRVERIAKGSGATIIEVRELLKQYKLAKKLLKTMKGSEKNMDKMMKRFGKGMPDMKFK